MAEEEAIILSTNNCEIRDSDIKTLSPHTYINDLIISFYYEIIQEKYPSPLITFLDPAVSMSIIFDLSNNEQQHIEDIKSCTFIPLQLDKKKFIFAPINDNTKVQYTIAGTHWILNVVDIDNNKIYYLDSMSGDVSNAHVFHSRIEKLFGKKFEFIVGLKKKYQTNSSDCGMFLLGFSEILAKYIVNNNMKLENNSKNDKKGLDYIFEGENLVKQSYMRDFRKNIINLIYEMAKNKKK